MKVILFGFVSLSLAASAQELAYLGDRPDLPLAKRNLEVASKGSKKLSELLELRWMHEFPIADAMRLRDSRETFNRSLEKLNTPDRTGTRKNAMYLLGVSGDPRAFEILRCFFETGIASSGDSCKPSSGGAETISSAEFEARSSVPRALAILIYTIDSDLRQINPDQPRSLVELKQNTRDQALDYL